MSGNPETSAGESPQISPIPPSPAPLSRRERREAERRGELGDLGEPTEAEHQGPATHTEPDEQPVVDPVVDPVVADLVAGPPADPDTTAPTSGRKPSPGRKKSKAGGGPGAGSDPGWLPLALLVGGPTLAGLALLVLTVLAAWSVPGHPLIALIVLMLGAGALVLLVLAVRRLLIGADPALVGALMTPQQEPRVWATIRDVATTMAAPVPVNLVVDGSQQVAVARTSGSRNMVIGLPLLLELEPPQFSAVLAHELAFSSHGGLPAASRLHGLGERLDTVLEAYPADVVSWVLNRYRDVFQPLAETSRRRVEEHAEERTAAAYGARQLAEARQRLVVVQLAWQALVEEYLPLSEVARMRPLLAEGLNEILLHRRDQLGREAAGSVQGALATQVITGPAEIGMLDDPITLSRIESAILLDEDPHGSWPEIAAAAGGNGITRQAERFVAQLILEPDEATLAGVLRLLDRPDRPIPNGGLAGPLTALAQDSLLRSGLAGFELTWTGPNVLRRRDPRGLWVEWDGDLAVGAAAHSPAGVDQLRSWLFAAGADMDRRYEVRRTVQDPRPVVLGPLVEPSQPVELHLDLGDDDVIDLRDQAPHAMALAAPPPLAGSLAQAPMAAPAFPTEHFEAVSGTADSRTGVTGASDLEVIGPFPVGSVDLLVYRSGLLLEPVPAPTLQDRTRALLGRTVDVPARLAELAELAGDHPEQKPGAWWIDRAEITTASLRERRSGFELILWLNDGSATTLRQRQTSALRGDPIADLRLLLPRD